MATLSEVKRVYNEGYDDTDEWLDLDLQDAKKHYSGRPDAVIYHLDINLGTTDFRWYLFGYDSSTQLIMDNNSGNNSNDNSNEDTTDGAWQNDYEYTLSGAFLVIRGYNGTSTELTIPSKAVIDGVEYFVEVDSL